MVDSSYQNLNKTPVTKLGRYGIINHFSRPAMVECALPQLAKILAVPCATALNAQTLFAIDLTTGEINPQDLHNIPGLEALDSAALMIIFTRYRELPDGKCSILTISCRPANL